VSLGAVGAALSAGLAARLFHAIDGQIFIDRLHLARLSGFLFY